MKNDYASLIRFLRLKNSVSQELLAKKIGTTKSNISRLENRKQNFIIDDLEASLNYLGYDIKIINKNGEDIMKEMNKELNGLGLSDMGYFAHFNGLNQNNIRVEFNLLDLCVMVNKDIDSEKYVSDERFEEIRLNLTDEDGYGDEYDEYLESSVELVLKVEDDKIVLLDNANNTFSEHVLKKIIDTFNTLTDNRFM